MVWHEGRALPEHLSQCKHAPTSGRPRRARELHACGRPGPGGGSRTGEGDHPRTSGRRDAADRRGWAHARKYFSLSEKYAAWADYHSPAKGIGIHAYAHKVNRPLRLTDEELRAHPEWRNFGDEVDDHPPMRGWLAVPLIGSDGVNYGFIQASDRPEGDFTEQDEASLVRLATLTATALDALAQLHLPEYRRRSPNSESRRWSSRNVEATTEVERAVREWTQGDSNP